MQRIRYASLRNAFLFTAPKLALKKTGRRRGRVLRPESTGSNCPIAGIFLLIRVRLVCFCCFATLNQFLRQFTLR
jgi:hypothetical protein